MDHTQVTGTSGPRCRLHPTSFARHWSVQIHTKQTTGLAYLKPWSPGKMWG
jgi:hypothetical protein